MRSRSESVPRGRLVCCDGVGAATRPITCNLVIRQIVGSFVQQVQVQQTTPGGQVVVTNVPTGVPRTNAEFRALLNKRGELSDQLVSAANRRKNLADQLRTADPDARAGIQARMKVLDDRIVRLETEIDRTG